MDITALSEDALARLRGTRIGFVFQFFHLLPSLTAYENVLVPIEIAGGADPRDGPQTCSPKSACRIVVTTTRHSSQGGEQQRVAIARALANNPSILLADEPTGNLDSRTGGQVIDLLLQIHRARKSTLVLVTHDPEIAAIADLTISLRDGQVVASTERPNHRHGLMTGTDDSD